MFSSWMSQSNCINLYIYEVFLEISASDGLAAQIDLKILGYPGIRMCVHTLHVTPLGEYACAQLPCMLQWWGAAHGDSSVFPLRHWSWTQELSVSLSPGKMSLLETSIVRAESCCLCAHSSPRGTMDTARTLLNIS